MSNTGNELELAEKKTVNLFQLLRNHDIETFRKRCSEEENKSHLDENDGRYTYLQYACRYGLLGAVEALLDNGANPNLTCRKGQSSPIMFAAREGYFEVVELLAKQDNIIFECTSEGTVLHAVLDSHKTKGSHFDMEKYLKCLEHLMDKVAAGTLDINAQNENGYTVLHLAVKLNEKRFIRLLLDNGAYIGVKCNLGSTAISLMNAKMLEEYLDDCIVTNDKLPTDDDYEIIYKYHFLEPPKICQRDSCDPKSRVHRLPAFISETEPLIELSTVPELRPLLKHPVLSSFLNLKWFTIRTYYWANFTFYLMFWLCLTMYTLGQYSPIDFQTNSNNTISDGNNTNSNGNNTTSKIDNPSNMTDSKIDRQKPTVFICTWIPSLVFCCLFFLREIVQFSVSPSRYVCDVENVLDIAMLCVNLRILLDNIVVQNRGLAAVAILLTWTELVLLINRHASSPPFMEMYMVVCKNFLKLLAWCSMLIVAFAFSFYQVFRDVNDNLAMCERKDDSNRNLSAEFFKNPQISFFKVILMMTGEYEISLLPLDCHPGFSHVLFVVFVVLVVIVLFNMINGLAVSDTQQIWSDAKIVKIKSQATLITYIEQLFACLNIFTRGWPYACRRPMLALYERANLFPRVLPNSMARVLPNLNNLVVLPNSDTKKSHTHLHPKNSCWILGYHKLTVWYLTNEIMHATKKILMQRGDREEQDYGRKLTKLEEKLSEVVREEQDYGRKLTNLEEKLSEVIREEQDYGRKLTKLEEKLNEVLELLREKHRNTNHPS